MRRSVQSEGDPSECSSPRETDPGTGGIVPFCSALVQFSGLAQGFAGLYQVNVQLPSGASSGNQVPLQLGFTASAGRPSNIVMIAIPRKK